MNKESGHLENNTISFTDKEFKEFQNLYKETVKDKKAQFSFKGNIFLTNYAKYLIEYLTPKFLNNGK